FHFPNTDKSLEGIDSKILLSKVNQLVIDKGFTIGNIDATLVLESPKINPKVDEIKSKISEILKIDIEDIAIKATTSEKMGFVGREEGVVAHAVVLIQKN